MTRLLAPITRRHSGNAVRCACGTLLLLLSAWPACGQERREYFPLGVEIDEASHLSRTCGPVRLQLEFDWHGPGILEGALAIELRDSEGQLLGQFVIDGLYLSEGKQQQEIMLPGFRAHTLNDELLLRMTLLDGDGDVMGPLEPKALRITGGSQRSLVIAACRSIALTETRRQNDLADLLRLESLFPDYQAGRPGRTLLTRTVFFEPEDLPAEPLRLCAYDLVLLSGADIAQAGQPELDALLAWVRAGGGLFLSIDESRLKSPQVAFVNALADAPEANPAFLTDSSGRLIYGAAETPSAPLHFQPGLGRAIVIGWNDTLLDPGAGHWPLTTAFLWRVRHEHLESIRQIGQWDVAKTLASARRAFEGSGHEYLQEEETVRQLASDMAPIAVSGGSGVVKHLLPEGLKLIPLSLIALILMGYVAVIGPLDYVVLGRLRLRRITWITFPAVTFGFTAFALLLSNNYMQTADHRSRITFRDLAAGGVVVRENRLELLFPSKSRQISTELSRGLFMPLRHEDFGQDMMSMYGPYRYQPGRETRAAPPRLTGRMPAQCRADQLVPQWTPQLNRILTIPLKTRPDSQFQFDWDRLPDFREPGADGVLAERVRQAFGMRASAFLFHRTEVRKIIGVADVLLPGDSFEQVYLGGQYMHRQSDFLKEISVPNQPGFLAVASELAPTGGDRFDDMSLLDPTDERQWVLVIGAPTDEGLVVYRRRYLLNDSPTAD